MQLQERVTSVQLPLGFPRGSHEHYALSGWFCAVFWFCLVFGFLVLGFGFWGFGFRFFVVGFLARALRWRGMIRGVFHAGRFLSP